MPAEDESTQLPEEPAGPEPGLNPTDQPKVRFTDKETRTIESFVVDCLPALKVWSESRAIRHGLMRLFPSRDLKSVWDKVNAIKKEKAISPQLWTMEEEFILVEFVHHHWEGPSFQQRTVELAVREDLMSLLPGRTYEYLYRKAMGKATKMNMTNPRGPRWTEVEFGILIEFAYQSLNNLPPFPKKDRTAIREDLQPLMPNRTHDALHAKFREYKALLAGSSNYNLDSTANGSADAEAEMKDLAVATKGGNEGHKAEKEGPRTSDIETTESEPHLQPDLKIPAETSADQEEMEWTAVPSTNLSEHEAQIQAPLSAVEAVSDDEHPEFDQEPEPPSSGEAETALGLLSRGKSIWS